MVYFSVFIPIVSTGANVLAQILSYKYILVQRLLRSEYFGFLCGVIVLAALQVFDRQGSPIEWTAMFCANLIVYLCLSYVYFHFINLGETARRIRILRELYDAPNGLTREQLLRKYNSKGIVDIRLARLINNNQVRIKDGRLYIGNKTILLISRVLVLLKRVVLGKRSEFQG